MDGVFGHNSFQNEVIWCYEIGGRVSKRSYGRRHEIIFFYTKSDKYTFNWDKILTPFTESGKAKFKYEDEIGKYRLMGRFITDSPIKGHRDINQEWEKTHPELVYRHYLKQGRMGVDWWIVPPINQASKERLGYPTQKPLALLERIITASSNEGDVIFDPFCGCGTAVYAAHLLGRKWIGCDIAILSVRLVRDVLLKRYGLKEGEHYEVSGVPLSVEGAEELFSSDPRQFQHWSVELAGGFSSTKYSGDKGIDGRIHFETKEGLKNMVISVKGGKLSPDYMRSLRGVLEREPSTEMGGLICLQSPTKGMSEEAANAGVYTLQGNNYDRLQIRTIQELLDGKAFDTPSKVKILGWQNQGVLPI
jgi:hypothetical protein